eukprot:scaffold3517_cov239-Pinguiococcus_pyrenoidosus.AAC.1
MKLLRLNSLLDLFEAIKKEQAKVSEGSKANRSFIVAELDTHSCIALAKNDAPIRINRRATLQRSWRTR